MKRVNLWGLEVAAGMGFVWRRWWRQKLPVVGLGLLCLNLAIAPVVYAATDGTLERRYVWAIGVLILLTLALLGYLFFVVWQPERF